ncbi:hypothetical protein A6770_14970 [Nostoc minutum NIES-26]|uniref:Uncharacterized protein n=1 Tax=Nostoc minutum NIES-26 TaxID=1844469 RepID=A0A367RK43_9NOSO|nr:hypothetical protein A6770_14970 [Nostoc minutum NIES-26]
MVQKVLSVKVYPEDYQWFKELANDFKTQADAFKTLRQVYQNQTGIPVEQASDNRYTQSVCVGHQLPVDWELRDPLVEKIEGRKWYVFPNDQVVATKQKSANGSKSWLEVAVEFSEEVWKDAKSDRRFKYHPVTTLKQVLAEYQDKLAKTQHPAIAEALDKGWVFQDWHWGLEQIIREAEDYLLIVNQSEPIQVEEVYHSVCDDKEDPLALTMNALVDRLAPKHLDLSTAKTDRGKANTLRDLPATLAKIRNNNISQWTSERDPEGYSWRPTDEARATWVVTQ